MALCCLKLGEYAQCIRACDSALELDSKNEKCFFRRGQSYLAMLDYNEAIKDFQQVLKLNPSNTAATQHIQTCREQ
ncbi:unnamed protein product, partial [Rotaria magnacalcarata]